MDAMNKLFGVHTGFHAFHAKVVVAEGRFQGSPEASPLSRAILFDGRTVPVTIRLSDNGGPRPFRTTSPTPIRGMPSSSAVRWLAQAGLSGTRTH